MQDQVDETKLKLDCKGGGRIRVNPQSRTISVYGYSMVNDFSLKISEENYLLFRVLVVLIMKKQLKF